MRLKIDTQSRRAKKELASLVGFVLPYFWHSGKICVSIRDHQGIGSPTHGAAWLSRKTANIALDLSRSEQYPFVSKLYGIEVFFQNWKEEFIHVLAHEMRHIDQLAIDPHRRRFPRTEVDAERYATMVLKEYREKMCTQPTL